MLYLLLADGFEETEAIVPLDMLRRAEIPVKTVGITGELVTGAHGISVQADLVATQMDAQAADGVILPGGMPGTLNLQKDAGVIALLEHCAKTGKLIAAICAAPMILGGMGLLRDRKATCFPGFEDQMDGAILLETSSVVRDDNIITAKGAGAALLFGAEIIDYMRQEAPIQGKGKRILSQMQYPEV